MSNPWWDPFQRWLSRGPAPDEESSPRKRLAMVNEQIMARGVRDPLVLAAIASVPRHLFVPEELRDQAYEDKALPIGSGQTISQPFVVAAMTERLDRKSVV